MIIWTYSD